MENKSVIPSKILADLNQSWHIPRPTLARSSKSGSTSSNSTQSAKSGTLLLTAANLAKVHTQDDLTNRDHNLQYYLQQGNNHELIIPVSSLKKPDPDSVSMASSTHFTVVNMNTRTPVKSRSFCRKHQLTILVVTMSVIFTIGILAAVLFLEMRSRNQQH